MRIRNLGCIGPEGLEVALDNIVCLVGANNSGKSTVLRAYECAVGSKKLACEEIHGDGDKVVASVELWVHIPRGVANVDEKWKTAEGNLLVVRSKWEWTRSNGAVSGPDRTTWDPAGKKYAADAKASGLDTVFGSRLPQPFRIGSLDGPESEHKELLKIVTEPIARKLNSELADEDSELFAAKQQLNEKARQPVAEFRALIEEVQKNVGGGYSSVFSESSVRLNVDLGDLAADPVRALQDASRVDVLEQEGRASSWEQQGTGSQRTLFWSILKVRSELDRKRRASEELDKKRSKLEAALDKHNEKSEPSKESAKKKYQERKEELEGELAALDQAESASDILPGHMLLIDEPETALHPSAVRAAKTHLYSLARDAGWQVMLTTHHPAFVDPLEDHTTIVRLHRPQGQVVPCVYRADDVAFSGDEREVLKSLMLFDNGIAEMFFGCQVVLVEGDTEHAVFQEVMAQRGDQYPDATRPLVLRARGKAPIAILIKMLDHFKADFSVLHDVDPQWTKDGASKNPAFSVNGTIAEAVEKARARGRRVNYRVSCPGFEQAHGLSLPTKDKPYAAWKAVKDNPDALASVADLFGELASAPAASDTLPESDGSNYEQLLQEWVSSNDPEDKCYRGCSGND